MSARGLRFVPRDEERATWCEACDRLDRVGVAPLLLVESCTRCATELPAWRSWMLTLIACALTLIALFAVGSL